MSSSTRALRFAAASAFALGLLILCSGPALAASVHTVAIDGTKYSPETITVKVGDIVVWVNKDPFPHTATSQAGGFDSKEIAGGKSWQFKATKAGVFAYTCTFHPTMKATLRVE